MAATVLLCEYGKISLNIPDRRRIETAETKSLRGISGYNAILTKLGTFNLE
jgi:hypothetical protein